MPGECCVLLRYKREAMNACCENGETILPGDVLSTLEEDGSFACVVAIVSTGQVAEGYEIRDFSCFDRGIVVSCLTADVIHMLHHEKPEIDSDLVLGRRGLPGDARIGRTLGSESTFRPGTARNTHSDSGAEEAEDRRIGPVTVSCTEGKQV